jgi:glycosyltransferase involved in cell wall biosynthesis
MILIISCVFPPEPVVSAQISGSLAEKLATKSEVTVLCPPPTRPLGYNYENNEVTGSYKVIKTSSYTCPQYSWLGRFRESYSFGKHCVEFIRKNHKNITVIYMNAWALFAQYLIVRIAKKQDIPVVHHVQDIYPEALTNKIPFFRGLIYRILLPLDKYILRNATSTVAISQKMKNQLAKTRTISDEKLTVVLNWQDETEFVEYKSIDEKSSTDFVFMYLGNIGPVAGVDLLIDAFVVAGLQNAKLVIAGSGSMKKILQEKCNALKINTIEFWDVSEGKVPEIQSKADVMLLPIKKGAAQSSIPSKLPAYMFSKKPVIACVDIDSDTANAILEANCGWIIQPESPNELAKKMKDISELPKKELEQKGENGFDYAMTHFSKRENLEKLVSFVEKYL